VLELFSLVLGFALLLPFFALLIWLRLIAAPKRMTFNIQLASISLLTALVSCAIGTRFAVVTTHKIWPQVQGALFALFVFCAVFGLGWWFDRKNANPSR
jgi:FtsH-binding integral membrane protein